MWHTVKCANCGITFAMDEDFYRRRQGDGETFYCPKGHGIKVDRPTKAELEKQVVDLERRLEETVRRLEWWSGAYDKLHADYAERGEALTTERRRSAAYRQHFERVKAEKVAGGADWRRYFSVFGLDTVEEALSVARNAAPTTRQEKQLRDYALKIEQMYLLLRNAEDRGVRWPVPGSDDSA